jgi:hypothetical protein
MSRKPVSPRDLECLDFAGLSEKDAGTVKEVIALGENFAGYIPENNLEFIIRNYRCLATLGNLEEPWLTAYERASHFQDHGHSVIKAVFDACDRDRLRKLKPLGGYAKRERLTLFRGCAGPVHSLGMSWTPSLDEAIWYAAHHASYYHLDNLAVYVATVPIADIYCRLDDTGRVEFVVDPREAWRVDVPAGEFRLDRPRP